MSRPTLLTPYGYSSSTCGYCSPSGHRSEGKTSLKYGLEAPQMSAKFYQELVDRGWRRSGDYVYHPDMARTCCPQYTIRLDAKAFKPSKKHRQVMNRWNRFVSAGTKPGETEVSMASGDAGAGAGAGAGVGAGSSTGDVIGSGHGQGKGKAKGKGKGKGKATSGEEFLGVLHEHEVGYGYRDEEVHRYETTLTPAKATKETFELYKRYQIAVHKDPPGKVTMRGFQRFLCDSPITESTIEYDSDKDTSRLPQKYGSYHLLYRVDGHLVGISVIDVLPHCVSSVYFIWDPDWAWASLGKLSALREVSMAREMAEAGAEGMGWLYMGYWIPDCQKMRYKSEYSPSYLLDPGTNIFHPLSAELDKFLQLHKSGYHPFASFDAPSADVDQQQAVSGQGEEIPVDTDVEMDEYESIDGFPTPPPPGFDDPSAVSEGEIDSLLVLMQSGGLMRRAPRLIKLQDLEFVNPEAIKGSIRELVAAVGLERMARSTSDVDELKDRGVLFFG
ncbi:hypothetical protein JCM24511_05473 [Saitozyma sp. JCM 24511]|nr:hypothetical protein JCM24511_05473 [Saitozyma sp. JCM 24511]